MAIVLGTNAGFVTSAPTSDPSGNREFDVDFHATAGKDTSPATAIRVTEIGWWCDNATQAANFEVGIYDDSGGSPNNLLAGASLVNAKGTTAGWKKATGLNITISSSTTYWIALQVDSTATSTESDEGVWATQTQSYDLNVAALQNPWVEDGTDQRRPAIYAVWSAEESAGTNIKINIGDVHKDVSEMKINISDTWKAVAEVKQNIGDVWKTVF